MSKTCYCGEENWIKSPDGSVVCRRCGAPKPKSKTDDDDDDDDDEIESR